MKRVRAGRLNQRIQIQSKSETPDTDYGGGKNASWTTVATIWAEVIPYGHGIEQFIGGATRSENSLTFRIRYRSDITASMRIVFQGRNYAIRGSYEPPEYRSTLLDIFAEAEQ